MRVVIQILVWLHLHAHQSIKLSASTLLPGALPTAGYRFHKLQIYFTSNSSPDYPARYQPQTVCILTITNPPAKQTSSI